jgi:rod shape-determining protein MreC
MDGFLSRYRNLSVLVIVIMAQLVLLAVQVKNNQDVSLIRVWAVTAITPLARVLEGLRANTFGVAGEYWQLLEVRSKNQAMKTEMDRLKMENQFLKEELATAKRVEAMVSFVQRNPSKTIGARIIGAGAGMNSKVVFIDRGSTSGVLKGMAVITPDGIVGKVTASYPVGSQVMLITDPTFACGVVSDKSRVHGTAKGQGGSNQMLVDYIQNEQTVEVGETFYSSGDDRIFPKGLPVGQVRVARQGKFFKEIFIAATAFERGLEEVLVVLEGVHQQIPDAAMSVNTGPEAKPMAPPPQSGGQQPVSGGGGATAEGTSSAAGANGAAAGANGAAGGSGPYTTDADRLMDKYKALGEQQGVNYGKGGKIPNFNAPVVARPAGTAAVAPAGSPASSPASTPATRPVTTPTATPAAPPVASPAAAPANSPSSGGPPPR